MEAREDVIKICVRLFGAKNMAISVMSDLIMKHEDDFATLFYAFNIFLNDVLLYK